MTSKPTFKRGDVVVHTRRPEWGRGVVDRATAITHEGQQAQRLVITFANHGRVTVNTAVATLAAQQHKEPTMSHSADTPPTTLPADRGWLSTLEQGGQNELWQLPEAMTDPFVSLAGRLDATLVSYRFDESDRGLIDWAVAQSGLTDPLSRYTRHDLEQAFDRFAINRQRHLNQLVSDIKKQRQDGLIHEQMRELRNNAARLALKKAVDR